MKLSFLLYFVISLLFVISFLLNCYGYQFAGYWTEKIIAWIWLIDTVFIILCHWKYKFTKIYLSVLGALVVLSLLPMGIVFFAFLNFIGTFGDYQRLSINDDYRLEMTQHQPLSMPRVYIYQRQYVIFEKIISRPIFYHIIEKTTGLDKLQFDERTISIQQATLIHHDSQTIAIRYRIHDKEMMMTHDDCFARQNHSLDCGW